MAKTKLLLINWRDIKNPEAGGAEIYYHEIFKRLARAGRYDVTVLCHAFAAGAAREEIDGIHVIRTGSRSLFNYAAAAFVRAHEREYDLIVEDLNKIPFFTPLYTSQPRLHLVMHFFRGSIFKEALFPMAAYVYALESLVPLVYRRERFVAISRSTAAEVLAWRRDAGAVAVVEPGIDLAAFGPVAPKDKTPLLVYFGRIKKYKNVQFVLRAFPLIKERVPGARLIIAGAGDYLDALKKLACGLGIDERVTFAGRVSEGEKREILSRATLAVNPSIKEGWGITTIEANLCGTITLSSNVPGLRDSVKDGVTGSLFRFNDTRDFVDKAVAILHDGRRRAEMERAALFFAKGFGWDAMAAKMGTIIDNALRSPACAN